MTIYLMHNFTSISTISPNFRKISPLVTKNSLVQNLEEEEEEEEEEETE